jgi:hypothetical protein
MRDPHVVALHYKLDTGPQLAFNNPPPIDWDADTFSLRLDNGALCVKMKDHFATVEDGRLAVESSLRSWEIAANLENGPGSVRFTFEHPDVIDLALLPPGSQRIGTVTGSLQVQCVSTVTLTTTRNHYPAFPRTFQASPNVVTMWGRYEGYLAGREPLPSMAYMCLTVLEASTGRKKGKRPAAAKQYKVHLDVLNTLGTLTSERGDAATARKVVAGRVLQPLSDTEIAWVKDVVRALICRVGEWEVNHHADHNGVVLQVVDSFVGLTHRITVLYAFQIRVGQISKMKLLTPSITRRNLKVRRMRERRQKPSDQPFQPTPYLHSPSPSPTIDTVLRLAQEPLPDDPAKRDALMEREGDRAIPAAQAKHGANYRTVLEHVSMGK